MWYRKHTNTSQALGWTGYIRVDNFTYQWLGDNATVHSASLDSFHITPTRTIFNLKAGPMNLNITFLTPIEVGTSFVHNDKIAADWHYLTFRLVTPVYTVLIFDS